MAALVGALFLGLALLVAYWVTAPFSVLPDFSKDSLTAFALTFEPSVAWLDDSSSASQADCLYAEDFDLPVSANFALLFSEIDDEYVEAMTIIALKHYTCIKGVYGAAHQIHGDWGSLTPYAMAFRRIFKGEFSAEFISSGWVVEWLDRNRRYLEKVEIARVVSEMCGGELIRHRDAENPLCIET